MRKSRDKLRETLKNSRGGKRRRLGVRWLEQPKLRLLLLLLQAPTPSHRHRSKPLLIPNGFLISTIESTLLQCNLAVWGEWAILVCKSRNHLNSLVRNHGYRDQEEGSHAHTICDILRARY